METTKESVVRIMTHLAAHAMKGQPSALLALMIMAEEGSMLPAATRAMVLIRASQLAPEWGMGLFRAMNIPAGAMDDIDSLARELIESLPVSFTEEVVNEGN